MAQDRLTAAEAMKRIVAAGLPTNMAGDALARALGEAQFDARAYRAVLFESDAERSDRLAALVPVGAIRIKSGSFDFRRRPFSETSEIVIPAFWRDCPACDEDGTGDAEVSFGGRCSADWNNGYFEQEERRHIPSTLPKSVVMEWMKTILRGVTLDRIGVESLARRIRAEGRSARKIRSTKSNDEIAEKLREFKARGMLKDAACKQIPHEPGFEGEKVQSARDVWREKKIGGKGRRKSLS